MLTNISHVGINGDDTDNADEDDTGNK